MDSTLEIFKPEDKNSRCLKKRNAIKTCITKIILLKQVAAVAATTAATAAIAAETAATAATAAAAAAVSFPMNGKRKKRKTA